MLRIHLNDPVLLTDLRDALAASECSSVPVSDDTLLVTDPLASHEAEAKLELAFFLRAWQERRPGAEIELLS
jgi:hypothetical protein